MEAEEGNGKVRFNGGKGAQAPSIQSATVRTVHEVSGLSIAEVRCASSSCRVPVPRHSSPFHDGDSMMLYKVVRKETWYCPDMFFYRNILIMLARNKKVDEARKVCGDLKKEVLFDQHTFGDLVRAFLDCGFPDETMRIYHEEMRSSPDLTIFALSCHDERYNPVPELREKVKGDLL